MRRINISGIEAIIAPYIRATRNSPENLRKIVENQYQPHLQSLENTRKRKKNRGDSLRYRSKNDSADSSVVVHKSMIGVEK